MFLLYVCIELGVDSRQRKQRVRIEISGDMCEIFGWNVESMFACQRSVGRVMLIQKVVLGFLERTIVHKTMAG